MIRSVVFLIVIAAFCFIGWRVFLLEKVPDDSPGTAVLDKPSVASPDADDIGKNVPSTNTEPSSALANGSFLVLRGSRYPLVVHGPCGAVDDVVTGAIAVEADENGEPVKMGAQFAVHLTPDFSFVHALTGRESGKTETLCRGTTCVRWDERKRIFQPHEDTDLEFFIKCPREIRHVD